MDLKNLKGPTIWNTGSSICRVTLLARLWIYMLAWLLLRDCPSLTDLQFVWIYVSLAVVIV
jgi:hypothetical protein